MKFKDLQKESDEQLIATLADREKHLFQLRFQSATDRLETPSEIRKAKRDLARIKTLQRQRELVELSVLDADELKKMKEQAEQGQDASGKPIVGKRKPRRIIHRINGLLGVPTDKSPRKKRK